MDNTKTIVKLGSTSTEKFAAVEYALKLMCMPADIITINAPSGQNPQPLGFEQTYAGALERATVAKDGDNSCIAIGIESGIFCFGRPNKITLDIAVVVLLTKCGRQIVTSSSGIQLPEKYVVKAEKIGFENITVGQVIAESMGGDRGNPHSVLSGGKITRCLEISNAVISALKQLQ